MMNGYYYGYSTPMMNYVNSTLVICIAAIVASVVGVVLYYTLFAKKNEDRFTGFKGTLYNLMTFNRFYAEDILKFLYIVLTCALTAAGIAAIVMGSFVMGVTVLAVGNIGMRLVFELLMMFIMLCRKSASMDRKLTRIANYYDDGYGEFGDPGLELSREEWEDSFFDDDGADCSGDCGSCGSEDCILFDDAEIEEMIDSVKNEQ